MEDEEEPHAHCQDPAPSLAAVTPFFSSSQHRSPRDISLLLTLSHEPLEHAYPDPQPRGLYLQPRAGANPVPRDHSIWPILERVQIQIPGSIDRIKSEV
jgi:hypothetical protein